MAFNIKRTKRIDRKRLCFLGTPDWFSMNFIYWRSRYLLESQIWRCQLKTCHLRKNNIDAHSVILHPLTTWISSDKMCISWKPEHNIVNLRHMICQYQSKVAFGCNCHICVRSCLSRDINIKRSKLKITRSYVYHVCVFFLSRKKSKLKINTVTNYSFNIYTNYQFLNLFNGFAKSFRIT